MNLSALHRKLITAARNVPRDERVPLAFETRIMSRLTAPVVPDAWGLWGQALSRAAVFCVALMAILTLAALLLPSPESTSLKQDVEMTLLAAFDNPAPTDQIGDTW